MGKIKFTKGELKKQRDGLKQYRRYLPTLQLKKQQLQMEIQRQNIILDKKNKKADDKKAGIERWIGLLTDPEVNIRQYIVVYKVITSTKNIAGVDLPLFERIEFKDCDYDLFITPLWVDKALDEFKELIVILKEIEVLEEGVKILKHELRIATQRVNLFEKVKIPEAGEAIRRIKIYIGDQMTNAVGRSKIAKRKIESLAAA